MSQPKWSQAEDGKEWDDFVLRNGGSIFHTWAWKLSREIIGSRSLYLIHRDIGGKIAAACPLVYRKTKQHFFYLESLHGSPIGGPIVDGRLVDVSESIRALQRSIRFSLVNPIISLQLRVHEDAMVQTLAGMGYEDDQKQSLFILDLESTTPEEIWNSGLEKHDRQAVKFYEGRSSNFFFANSKIDISDYLALQEETMRRGGDQPRSMDYFLGLQKHFGERFKISMATVENRPVAGFTMLCDVNKSTLHLGLSVGYSKAKNMHSPMVFMNWKLVNWASENGFRFVSFGRTESKSTDPIHRLKQRFSSKSVPIHRFTIPTSKVSYSIAKSISGIISRGREKRAET